MKQFGRIMALMLAVLMVTASFTLWVTAEPEAAKLTVADIDETLSSAGNGSSEGLAQMFDGNKNSKYLTASVPAEVVFALSEAAVVTYYELTSADHGEWDPKAWKLYGSSDKATWTELDSRSGEDFLLTPDTNGYSFENTAAYTWYKLEVTESHGEAYGFSVAISEMELFVSKPAEDIEGAVVDLSTVTGSEGNGSSEGLLQAFDGNTGTKYLTKSCPAEIIFALKKAVAVCRYELTSTDHGEWDPKAWTLYGSDNGTDWVELDSQADQNFTGRGVTNAYEFDNEDDYLWYKLEVTESHGEAYGYKVAVAEFALSDEKAPDPGIVVDPESVTGTPGNGSSEGLAQMFDGNPNSKYLTNTVPAEIIFSLNRKAVVNYYELTSTDHGEWDPKAWKLYGSDDKTAWTEIDSRKDEDFAGRGVTNAYFFDNKTEYLWYKLEVTESHGEAFGFNIAIAEMTVAFVTVAADSISGSAGNGDNNFYNLFDGSADTKYLVFRDSDDEAVTVCFKMTKPVTVNGYRITSANDQPVRDPKSWNVYGSEDGENWVKIDERADQDQFPMRKTAYAFQFDNEDAYEWYKFEFTSNFGIDPWNFNIIQIGEIELFYAEEEIVDDSLTVLIDTITSSDPYNDSHTADKLFDGSVDTKFLTNGKTMWVAFSLKTAKAVNAYTITCANDWASRNPYDWTFYGSEDGVNWIELDKRTGEIPAALKESAKYVFANDTEFLWYKLDVTKNGGNGITGFAELTLERVETPACLTTELAVDGESVTAPAGNSGSGVGNLFDDDNSTRYLVQNNGEPFDVIFSLVKPGLVNRYAVSGSKDHLERSPKTFSFYGSVDGTEWVELDSQDLEAKTSSDPNYFCGGTFTFENKVVYTYYKLHVEAVSGGSLCGINTLAVYTASPADGVDVYVPANVSDLTGVCAASKVRSAIVKAPALTDESVNAVKAAAPVTVYGNKTLTGEGLAAQLAGAEGVTFINILSLEKSFCETKNGENIFTAVAALKVPDLEYKSLKMDLCFYQGGAEIVPPSGRKSVAISNVYTTINGYASVNPDTAQAQGYETVDAAYLAAVSVAGIIGGNYTVRIVLTGTVETPDGEVEVVSDPFETTTTF